MRCRPGNGHVMRSECTWPSAAWVKHAIPPYARLTSTRTTLWHRRQCRRGCRGRDPPIFDLQGSSCVDDPPIFSQVFYFFCSAELLNTASRCHFHLQCAQCTVFNSTVEQNSPRMTTNVTPSDTHFDCPMSQFLEHNYWFIYWFFATCSAIDTNSYQ